MNGGHWKIGMMLALLGLSGCGDNSPPAGSEQIKAYGAEVLNQYQRRADLAPNLVSTVKGYAAQNQQVLTQVSAARAAIVDLRVAPELLNNPEALAKFQSAQTQLSGSLSRLVALTKNNPPLKADGLACPPLKRLRRDRPCVSVASP